MPYPDTMSSTAGKILNRVAAEVGIAPETDPFAATEARFAQMRWLLNVAGDELLVYFPWNYLQNEHQIITDATDSGNYQLPADFAYMIDQTGWERAQNVPLRGPLSPQDWSYLLGRDLVTSTIYASFRLKEGLFSLFPQPPPAGLDVHFEYVSQHWVQDGDDPTLFKREVEKSSDVPVYNSLVISRYLKVKYMESHGMDTSRAQTDFNQIYATMTGRNMSAKMLNAGANRGGPPYLDIFRNTPDTGYGIP